MKEDRIILVKILLHKKIHYTKVLIRFTYASLHVTILKDYNNNTEKVVTNIEYKIKILSCGREESSSVFSDIYSIFLKSN